MGSNSSYSKGYRRGVKLAHEEHGIYHGKEYTIQHPEQKDLEFLRGHNKGYSEGKSRLQSEHEQSHWKEK